MSGNATIAAGLLLLIALSTSCRRSIPPAADREAITATVQAFHDALAQGDDTAASALLAPDAQILEMGVSETRDEYQRGHLGADIAFAKAIPSTRMGMIVRQEGAVAWTTESSQSKGRFMSREVDSTGTELMVLAKTPEGWRIRAIHWSGLSHQSKVP